MDLRVEELAARSRLSVDTIRYYQARGLLPPPTRSGRIGLYGDEHLARLAEIRRLQARGFSLAVIRRVLAGELDAADEALVAAVRARAEDGTAGGPDEWLTLEDLAARSGIPLPLLQAVEREGLLVPRHRGGGPGYSIADVHAAQAALRLLRHGLPLPELLELARAHGAAVRATTQRAVALFDAHVRLPLREQDLDDDEAAARLVAAFDEILPATIEVVAHHFGRTLLAVAEDYIERVGTDGERQLVAASAQRRSEDHP